MDFYKNFYVHKNMLLVREVRNGRENRYKLPIKPSYYFVTDKESEYKSIYKHNLIKLDFDNQFEAREWIKQYDTMRDKIYGFPHHEYVMINEQYPGTLQFDLKKMNIAIIDIETQTEHGFPDVERANEVINLISITISGNDNTGVIKCFGFGDAKVTDKDAEYIQCRDEKDLLKQFLNYWIISNIDIVSGWNIAGFDIPYIIKRMEVLFGEDYAKQLSPWKIITKRQAKNDFGQEVTKYEIAGINILDYLELYRKYVQNDSESYKLGYIAQVELDDDKIEFDCSFKEFYTNHYQTFVDYNIHDVRIVKNLETKLGYIALACAFVYKAKIAFQDVFTVVRVWDVILTNILSTRNILVPTFINGSDGGSSYGGGYVKDPITGFFKWLISIDATSLYPSIERTLNQSPETILDPSLFISLTPDDIVFRTPRFKEAVKQAHELNACLSANGALFSREKQGIIPEMNELYFNQRKVEKELGKKYEKAAAMAASILRERGIEV